MKIKVLDYNYVENIDDLKEIKKSLNTRYKVEQSEKQKEQILIDLNNTYEMIQ